MTSSNTVRPRDIPFASLVAFEATARLGKVSRAADELNLTQSAVSQRVLKLEAHVGQRLFIRHGHGVKLTGAGELLLATTRDTLQRLQAGFDRIAPYKSKASLLLACPADFAHGWLMPRLGRLRALHDGLEVWLMPDRQVTDIDRIDVDLIVSRRPLHRSDVECVRLLEDASVAVAGPRWARTLRASSWPALLEQAPLLFLESEPEWGGLLASPALKALHIQRAATIQDERLLLDAVRHEQGLAWLPQLLVRDEVASGRIAVVEQVPAAPRERLWLMRSRLTQRTLLANSAFDWLLAEAAQPGTG
jgi:LysR family transcriptional regulator, glycine cleavage system transcriptional activator